MTAIPPGTGTGLTTGVTAVPPTPGLHLLKGYVPVTPVATFVNPLGITMPYWCIYGRRVRYVTQREIDMDAKYDWQGVIGHAQLTAAEMGQMQCVHEDGLGINMGSSWPPPGDALDPIVKFPKNYVWQPLTAAGANNLAVDGAGLFRNDAAPLANTPALNVDYWFDEYGPYDRVSRIIDTSDAGDFTRIRRYDVLSFYGPEWRYDLKGMKVQLFGYDFHYSTEVVATVINYSATNPPPPCNTPTFNFAKFNRAKVAGVDYNPVESLPGVATPTVVPGAGVSTSGMRNLPTLKIEPIKSFKLSEANKYSWNDYVTQVDQKANATGIHNNELAKLALVRDNLHADEKKWETHWFAQLEADMGRSPTYLEYVKLIAQHRMVSVDEVTENSRRLRDLEFKTDIQTWNVLFFECASRAQVDLSKMETQVAIMYFEKLPEEIAYAIHQKNATSRPEEYAALSWEKHLRKVSEFVCKQMHKFMPSTSAKRSRVAFSKDTKEEDGGTDRKKLRKKDKNKAERVLAMAEAENRNFMYAKTEEKIKECIKNKACFDCGKLGHRIGSEQCPKYAKRKKLDAASAKSKESNKGATAKSASEEKDKATSPNVSKAIKSLKKINAEQDKKLKTLSEQLSQLSSGQARSTADSSVPPSAGDR